MSVLSKIETTIFQSIAANARLATANSRVTHNAKSNGCQTFHKTTQVTYPAMKPLPLPSNLEDIVGAEFSRFSHLRSRDINGSIMSGAVHRQSSDRRVYCYDSTGSVSLGGAMQTNVPQPSRDEGLYTHFNMPGGLWRQREKYVAADHLKISTLVRHFSSQSNSEEKTPANTNSNVTQSRKEKLKAAVKQYGAVVIVFHVGISLASLGACYLAVTSGFDFSAILNKFKGSEGAEAATTAAPFVVAYAIHKAFAPVRISITLVSVPFIVKYLRKIGFVKAPPK